MITRRLFFHFSKCETEKPIVYHLVKDYDLIINIFRAKVTPEEEGYLVLDVTGTDQNIQRGMEFMKTFNVTIEDTIKGLNWNGLTCTHCGNCITHCPTHALHIEDSVSREVSFDASLCIECLSCIKNCPFGACTSVF